MASNKTTVNTGIDSRVYQNSDRAITGTKANQALKLITENYVNKVDDIVDTLVSEETEKSLSANQGKVLNDGKVDKVTGKGLSANDFTNVLKAKLDSITEIFTTALKDAYDSAVTWISTNGTNLLNSLQTEVTGNITSVIGGNYINTANATYTDPSPTQGKGFTVFVRNGTATVGGTAYSLAGSKIKRIYHSGSWANYYDSPFNDATSSIQTQLTSKVTNVLTTIGDLLYGGISGVQTRLSGNTSTVKQYLSSVGDGVNPLIPTLRDFNADVKSATTVVGNIYTEAFEATTIADNYTVTGAATFTQGASKITVDGSASWASLKNFISGSQKQGFTFRWQYNTNNTQGLGVGWQHPTIAANKLHLFLDGSTAASAFINTVNAGTIDISNYIVSTNKTMSLNVGDVIRYDVSLLDWALRFTVYNERSSAALVLYYVFQTGNSGIAPVMNFMGNPTIFANGGSHDYLTFENNDYNLVNPDYIGIIDSIGKGYNLVNWQSSFLAKAQANGVNIIPFGAHGATLADFTKTAIYNYLAKFSNNGVKPKIVIQAGSNSAVGGFAAALVDLAALITALEGLGYTVIICDAVDRVSQTSNINSYNAGILSAYAATNTLIDVNSVLGANTSLFFASDGIHLSVQGADAFASVLISSLQQGKIIDTETVFNTQRTYDVIENLAPIPTTAGALIGVADTTITVTGTSISTWPQRGYIELFNTSTGLSEIIYYPRRDDSNFYGCLRAQWNTTAISTLVTISFGRIAYIDKIRGENIFGKKAMYYEFGAVTNSANRAPAFVYGLDPKRYFLNAQYTWISESNTVFNFVQKGATSDLGVYFSKGATGQSTNIVFGFLNASSVLPSSTFNLKHTATNQMAFGPNTDPTLGLNLNTLGYAGINTTSITSQFQVTGSLALGYVAKTGTYTATVADYLINCTANTFTVTLPTAVGITGRVYEVVNSGAGTITVATTSSQTFVNVTATPTTLTIATALGAGIRVMSNGANWIVL